MSLNDKATAALTRELAKCFPERDANDPGHARLAAALSDTARHTQGDWLVSGSFITNESGTAVIAKVANSADTHLVWQCSTASMENAANARLIAAAPELLEALRTVLMRLDLEPVDAVFPCSAMREDIRAAIARAEGGAK